MMKKLTTYILLTALVLSLFAGCGNTAAEQSVPAPEPVSSAPEQTEMTRSDENTIEIRTPEGWNR